VVEGPEGLGVRQKKDYIMSYYYNKVVTGVFEEVVTKVIAALKTEGFGVLTQINVTQTLKDKINVDFRKYRILGACNPPFAYKALQAEDKIGTMLPCNVIVQEKSDGSIEVAAINPMISMLAVKNSALEIIASEIQNKLHKVIDSLS
jgi:uncharacterized protein (DUF302 family)